jgi:hypothetical protein
LKKARTNEMVKVMNKMDETRFWRRMNEILDVFSILSIQ